MFTKAGAKFLMERNRDVRLTECTIRAHCQTRVFELPKTHISKADSIRPATIVERQNARATIVSNLTDYFRNHTLFQHFSNCGVLRSRVDEAISNYTTNSTSDRFPLFVVIEQQQPCEARLEKDTCYIVDQGKYFGGDEGEDAIMAIRVSDAPWPELDENDTRFVNFVLATVKIVQSETEVIREIVGSSCFVDDLDRAVYALPITLKGNLISSSPMTEVELDDKLCELRKLARALDYENRKNRDSIEVLCDALRLESIETDHYRCAWYLSLLEATKAMLSGKEKHNFYQRHRDYRKSIGHPKPNTKMDMDQFIRLQSDAISTLKKHFLDT